MKVLLFGADGQLGAALQPALAPLGELISVGRNGAGDLCGDLRDRDGIRASIRSVAPSVVVNAAAFTAVDDAENERDLAIDVNALAPRVIAEEVEAANAIFVHYSTDFVFDGLQTQPYREEDKANPLSCYGESKLAGDMAIVAACTKHLILRTSWVFSANGNNFMKTILRLAAEKTALRVVSDQHGTPTGATLIAETTAALLSIMTPAESDDSRWGLYNLVADGQSTWHEFAKYIVSVARERGMKLQLAPGAIEAISAEQYPTPAMRPAYSVLDTTKIRQTFGLTFPCWKLPVDQALSRIAVQSG